MKIGGKWADTWRKQGKGNHEKGDKAGGEL